MPQVWTNKNTLFDKLIVVAEDAVFSADIQESALEECRQRIEGGEPPLNVLGEKATMIPFFSINKVKVDEHDSDIDVDYKAGKESKNKTLAFDDIESRKLAFTEIQARLGDKFTSMTDTYNVPRAVYAPLMTLTVLALVTWLLHGAAAAIAGGEEAEFSGRHSGIKRLFFWILELLGPTGVLILGGLFMLLALMSLANRIKQPPVVTTLKEGKQRPGGVVGTLLKYSILAGMWYLFAPRLFAAVVSF